MRSFVVNFLAAAGLISAVVQFVGQLYFRTVFPAPVAVTVGAVLACLAWGLTRTYPRSQITRAFRHPSTTIRVKVGNLFEQKAHLVIGFTDTFDTSVVNDRIINSSALQGQFLREWYSDDRHRLDRELSRALARHRPVSVENRETKRLGKLTRYPIGTVAVLGTTEQHVFALAYSRMGNDLVPRSSADDLWRSLSSLWDAFYEHGQRRPLAMAVLGSGAARIDQLDREALVKLIIMSFLARARQSPICQDLQIVIHPSDVDTVDLLDVAAFLRAL
ncbi:macro domain-containing protein [Nonomuraea sp. NPDC050663]|uniref:macro domain-containing protein n=1 Tax=Nonomuraea sp. NPDC050663 TaxID=3364370 RepID=UPI003797F112